MVAVAVLPISISALALAWISHSGGLWWLDALGAAVFCGLGLDAVRRATQREASDTVQAGGGHGEGSSEGDQEHGAPYLLVRGEEHDLLRLEAESSLREMVEKTPFRGVRIAAADGVGTIMGVLPGAEIVPWTVGFNESIMDEHNRLQELCQEKIADAMASDSAKMAAQMENAELTRKLSEALDANRKYESVLQDLRSRPVNSQADYSKMTPSQRGEEEKRLREGLAKLQELAKAGRLEPISIPSHFRQIGKL